MSLGRQGFFVSSAHVTTVPVSGQVQGRSRVVRESLVVRGHVFLGGHVSACKGRLIVLNSLDDARGNNHISIF